MKRCTGLIVLAIILSSCKKTEWIYNEGMIHGTLFHFIYEAPKDLQPELMDEMHHFDKLLSAWDSTSVLSQLNRNDIDSIADTTVLNVFKTAIEYSKVSDGYFDISVAPMVRAWGFGTENEHQPKTFFTPLQIDSLKEFVGYKRFRLNNNKIIKDDPRITFDVSALAKGYSCDCVANYLKSKGVKNIMIEIGGEITVAGTNQEGKAWGIGIDKPIDDPEVTERVLEHIIKVTDKGIASSGNYRQFYIRDGKKYAHTIDPHTGYPVTHNLLSSTVVAKDCMTADALATACMAMGVEKSMEMSKRLPDVEVLLIYSENDSLKTVFSPGMKQYIVE